jgi:UDP-N-acetylmuramate--alanine ligase
MFVPGHFLFAPSHRIHFIGIGGIGMSGIAEILLTMGYSVSGSDLRRTPITDRLATLGAHIFEGHAAANAAATDVVVTSSAVSPSNPEVLEARARKIPVIQRAEMLAELMRLKYGIAVAGMHGKTTTTSMIAAVLGSNGGNLDPTIVVGGRVDFMGSNARLGTSQYLVAEADESDRSFLKLSPILGVVTNLDREHMDCYRDLTDVESAFLQFMDGVPFYGATTACLDNPLLAALLPRVRRKVYTYGESAGADFRLEMLPKQPHCHSCFHVNYRGLLLGPFHLHVPGRHNVLNATAAIAIGVQLGVAPDQIAAGLETFRGVDRRFQVKGEIGGITVIDDYGHHPTEIAAVLAAARATFDRRLVVVFQPHRYSRTQQQLNAFGPALRQADEIILTEIYAASEEPIEGITVELLAAAIRAGAGRPVHVVKALEDVIPELMKIARPGDAVITLGAGSIGTLPKRIVDALQQRGGGA